jgi:hypothetical protein
MSLDSSSSTGIDVFTPTKPTVNLTYLLAPLLAVISIGLGTTMSMADLRLVWYDPYRRRALFVSLITHYAVVPLLSFAFAFLFAFETEVAVGLILVGCSPVGMHATNPTLCPVRPVARDLPSRAVIPLPPRVSSLTIDGLTLVLL